MRGYDYWKTTESPTPLHCTQCGEPIDEFYDGENEICEACYDANWAEDMLDWRARYDGEKQAGLLPRNHYR